MASTPSASSRLAISALGRGVILSIIVQGKATCFSSLTQARKASVTNPPSRQASATRRTASRRREPFFEQLSMETRLSGPAPARKRSQSIAATIAIAVLAFSGPPSMSAATAGK